MSKIRVEYRDNEIAAFDHQKKLAGTSTGDADFDTFNEWIDSYNYAVKQYDNKEALLKIGKDIFAWLNSGGNWLADYLKNPVCPLVIEFRAPVRSSDAQKAFIEAPWELLADDTGHLAKDPDLKFCPVRRIGEESDKKRDASTFKLNTVFMAAAPRRVQPELAFEREESAILNLYADKAINMDLFVEESGNLSLLTGLIDEVKPVDVLHLSCHGNIDYRGREKSGPYLCLESITGELERVTDDEFERKYSQNRPGLIFLSACKTSEAYTNKESSGKKEYGSFTQTIIKRGFPAVLGWSGSVSDFEATRFAGEFYRNLSLSASLEGAVANARYSLFIPPEERPESYQSRDWHLARLFLGAAGGGVLSS
jgi:hypothetical protein